MKTCINCGKNEISERKRCKECALVYNRIRAKKYYKKDKKRYGTGICTICGETLKINRKGQTMHRKCQYYKTVENYNLVKRSNKGKTVARQIVTDLGFKLAPVICVHHIDENTENNTLNNFWLISRKNHAKLHAFLRKQRSLLGKLNSSNLENCWKTLRNQLTTTWLEITGVNVIKIIDIGQSAAEPLNKEYIYTFDLEEGSETMYQVPVTD